MWISRLIRSRHGFDAFMNYNSITKLANLVRAEYHRLRKDVEVSSSPYSLFVDPINVCNLRCPFCATGNGALDREKRGLMPISLFRKVIDEIADRLYMVFLFDWGEPLLNPDIYSMVNYAHKKNIYTCIHSNFNVPFGETESKNMINSGLSHLNVSIDGVSQEVYAMYRRGGRVERVLDNIRVLVRAKRQMKSSRPHIRWRYIAFRHNEHEIAEARMLARQLGVDEFRVIRGIVEDSSWLSKGLYPTVTSNDNPETCSWLWRSTVIHVDGGVGSCCYQHSQRDDFGSVQDTPLMTIWNGQRYRMARAYLANLEGEGPAQDLICRRCPAVDCNKFYSSHSTL